MWSIRSSANPERQAELATVDGVKKPLTEREKLARGLAR
jgi:hypothetical protein